MTERFLTARQDDGSLPRPSTAPVGGDVGEAEFAPFEMHGDKSTPYGLFPCAPADRPVSASAGTGSGCC
ncbi:hypothetical protein AA958_17495 [Streptomyces sp. CNQ-509]|uniref:hypothetical protein n=1 Tax=Streptomyces sp. CNQ-509 TaxID=444103 RepID=UPI00062DDC55|nr:hypothetical protein [Streptomyces sp. CNQ-509]AKH83702.1 hypothetical protein AA958_17495 [Streptomyces sp. CNQ-509]